MKPHLPLSIGLLALSSVLLALLVNGYSILGFSLLWLIGLLAFGGLVSAFHHRAVHRSWALDTVLVSSAVGLGLLASVLVFSLIGSLLPEGSVQPHVLIGIIMGIVSFIGLFVIQLSYELNVRSMKHVVVRSLIGAGAVILIAVLIVQTAATIMIYEQVEISFEFDPEAGHDLERRVAYEAIAGTPLSEAVDSFRLSRHEDFKAAREPLRSCHGMLIDTVVCSELVVDSISSTVDLVVLELLVLSFVEDAANATIDGRSLDPSERALLEETRVSFHERFSRVTGMGNRLDSIRTRFEQESEEELSLAQFVRPEQSVLSRSFTGAVQASAYGASLRDLQAGVMERTHMYRTYTRIAAPALLAEEHPELLDDPLFISVTRDRIEKHREQATTE
ncbi:MAG: hypothetical protein ACMXYM_00970 [Candidatus Woesearchaeota archaeon]